jgi:hypothetical protein
LTCKKVSLEGELPVAEINQTMERKTQEIDGHRVIVAHKEDVD